MKSACYKILLLCYLLNLNQEVVLISPCSFPFDETPNFAPTHYQNGIIFISPGEDEDNENQSTGLFYAEFIAEGELTAPVKIKTDPALGELQLGNGDFCEATGEFYFTASKTNLTNSGNSAIYTARLIDFTLTQIKQLPLNDPNFSFAHPTLSSDGLTMIITANLEDNFDLYEYTRAHREAPWEMKGKLVALASPFHEVSPYLLTDSTLVYSSGAENGLGGLDLYRSKKIGGTWTAPTPLKELNSEKDDFGYLELTTNAGLFSSNREADKDHMYYFRRGEE